MRRIALIIAAAVVTTFAGACSGSDKPAVGTKPARTSSTTAVARADTIVFNGEGNNLSAYSARPPFTKQTVIQTHDKNPAGLDINGQICFDPKDPRRFVAGEDTGQPDPPQGWAIFVLSGSKVGDLHARRVARLVPTYQGSGDNAENYGCGFLADGRILTVDVGNQASGPGDGQLIEWFPPIDSFTVKYCKLDVGLTTGQGMLVDGDAVYVAQARAGVVTKYDAKSFPAAPDAAHGCGAKDSTGAPLASSVKKADFIKASPDNTVATPNAIVHTPSGGFYVSSVLNGVIAEFDANGKFVRDVLSPPSGEKLGDKPFSTGTPLGLGVDPSTGSIYFADIGLVLTGGPGPGNGTGTVRRITFRNGEPEPPEVMDSGLDFPDGIGIWSPSAK